MPDPAADDGLGAMPDDQVDVIWEVAADDRFRSVVARGVTTTSSDEAHAVHVDVKGLEPATRYHYRFTVGEWTSPPGRTRTLPAGSPDRFRIAVANCQWRETGEYAAYRHIAEADIDLVLHLGDYVYEYGARGTDAVCETLADWRLQYARYRTEPRLAAAHARHPFVCTWDDHEVANNIMGDVLEGSDDPAVARSRKAAAYQAWWEHLPVRMGPPDGSRPPRLPGGHDRRPGPHPRARRAPGRGRAAVPRHAHRGGRHRRLRGPARRGPHPAGRRTRSSGSRRAWPRAG